jgi:alkylation response protein AidB-like acyl-CoA dehydrogenase
MATLTPLLGAAFPVPALPADELHALARLQDVIDAEIAPNAAAADAAGRYPTASVAALKRSGILTTGVPSAFGGLGASHHVSLEAQVRLGAADSAVAQIFKIHDELTREIFRYSPDELRQPLADRILHDGAILGLAVAESGRTVLEPMTTIAARQADGSYVIDGRKIYTTGAAEADLIAVWGFDPVAGAENPFAGMQLNLVPRGTVGVTVHRDWDALGQRATDSGTITFEGVRTDPALRASQTDRWPVDYAPIFYQAGFAAIVLGIGIGAIREASGFVATQSRPWPYAAVDTAVDDPMVRRLVGELTAELVAAYSLVHTTADLFDAAAAGDGVSRTQVAIPVYALKSVATKAGLRAANEVFALMGTRSTGRQYGFDRWWRNARTLSLHDPIDWKHAEIGAHVLTGWDPPFGVYT